MFWKNFCLFVPQYIVKIKNCCFPVNSNPCRKSSESGALELSCSTRHIYFHLCRIYVALVSHSIALSLQYLILLQTYTIENTHDKTFSTRTTFSGPARGYFGGGGAWGKIFSKLQHLKNCCKSYLNANKMKLQGKNKTIINIVEFS